MYKDKDKQREANAERQRRYKAKQKALLSEGVTDKALPVCPYCLKRPVMSDNAIACEVCSQMTLISPKRGKDIKCFADLHPSIQATINRLSTVDGKIDQTIKANRIAIAINYQHLFPDRYEPTGAVCTGVVTGKLGDADYNGVCSMTDEDVAAMPLVTVVNRPFK